MDILWTSTENSRKNRLLGERSGNAGEGESKCSNSRAPFQTPLQYHGHQGPESARASEVSEEENFWKHGLLLLLLLLLSTPQNRSGGLQHSCSDLLINHLYHAGLFFYTQPEAEGFTVDHYRWVTAATLSFCPTAQMVSAATLWTNHHLALLIYRILSFCCGLQKLHSLHMNY